MHECMYESMNVCVCMYLLFQAARPISNKQTNEQADRRIDGQKQTQAIHRVVQKSTPLRSYQNIVLYRVKACQ